MKVRLHTFVVSDAVRDEIGSDTDATRRATRAEVRRRLEDVVIGVLRLLEWVNESKRAPELPFTEDATT